MAAKPPVKPGQKKSGKPAAVPGAPFPGAKPFGKVPAKPGDKTPAKPMAKPVKKTGK